MNDAQIKFLRVFQFYQGDRNKTLKACGIEENHLSLWMEDDDFTQNFNGTQSEIIQNILSDFRFNYIRMVQELIVKGYKESTVIRTFQTTKNGVATIKKSSKHTRKMIPHAYLKDLLNYNNVENSINNLAQQGLIPRSMARRFLSTAQEYQSKLASCFAADDSNDKFSDERAIKVIKQALLGSDGEIG